MGTNSDYKYNRSRRPINEIYPILHCLHMNSSETYSGYYADDLHNALFNIF